MSSLKWLKCLFFLYIGGLVFSQKINATHADWKAPRNSLENRIFLLYKDSREAKNNFSRKILSKVILPLLKPLIDIDKVTKDTLGKHYSLFNEEELLEYQRNFITLLLSTLKIKSKRTTDKKTSIQFTHFPWNHPSQMVAIRIYLEDRPTSLILIFEFDEQGKYLIDFYFNGESSIAMYREQFAKIIDERGKKSFLRLLDKRAAKVN